MRHSPALAGAAILFLLAGCGGGKAERPRAVAAAPVAAAAPPPPEVRAPDAWDRGSAAAPAVEPAVLGAQVDDAPSIAAAGPAPPAPAPIAVPLGAAAGRTATEWCDVAGRRVASGDCERLREQRDALRDGMGGMTAPSSMFVGEQVDLTLVVGRGPRAGQVVRGVTGASPALLLEGLKVGSTMAATLTGSAGLRIEPAGEQRRDLGGADAAVWEWRVAAVGAGPQELRLLVATVALDGAGEPTTLALEPRRFAVAVAVRPASAGERFEALPGQVERTANAWTAALKALGALFAAAGATWAAWRALRRPAAGA